MKLEHAPIVIERSEDFEEQEFGISDVTVIMEILRSKLYSNPIKVLVQEYMSNARDAHRELGKEDVAIEVTLPTEISPQFEVRDFGPGLTPTRLKDVFIKYGSSTKRGSNTSTGGFGIGAKSGWSYSDTFHVVSITHERGENVKRSYSCVVDETRNGKLIKFSDNEITTEPCGVRIVVPAKKENFRQFKMYALQVGMFWKTRPVVHGETFNEIKCISHGANWKYFDKSCVPDEFRAEKTFVICDGIPYPLKVETLKDSISPSVLSVLDNACFGLYFNTGDISISANREEIHYTEKTKAILAQRVNEVVVDFAARFNDEINKKKTFLEALLAFNNIGDENRTIGKLISDAISWNGIKLHEIHSITGDCGDYVKVEAFYTHQGAFKQCRKSSVTIHNLNPANVYLNDEPLRGAPLAKIKSMYYHSKDKDKFEIYVISFATNNLKTLGTVIDPKVIIKKVDEWKIKNAVDHFGFKKTSSIPKSAIPKGANVASGPKAKLARYRELKFDASGNLNLIEYEDYETDLKGYYIMSHDGYITVGGGQSFLIRDRYELRRLTGRVKYLFKHLNIDKIIILSKRNASVVQNNTTIVPLKKDIYDDIVKSFDVNKLKEYVKYNMENTMSSHNFVSMLLGKASFISKLHPGGNFAKKIHTINNLKTYFASPTHAEVKDQFSEFGGLIHDIHKVKVSDNDNSSEKINTRYPLLASYTSYYITDHDKYLEHAIEYINLVDSKT